MSNPLKSRPLFAAPVYRPGAADTMFSHPVRMDAVTAAESVFLDFDAERPVLASSPDTGSTYATFVGRTGLKPCKASAASGIPSPSVSPLKMSVPRMYSWRFCSPSPSSSPSGRTPSSPSRKSGMPSPSASANSWQPMSAPLPAGRGLPKMSEAGASSPSPASMQGLPAFSIPAPVSIGSDAMLPLP